MPVYEDQNGNLYFNAAALNAADSLVPSVSAALVTALSAVSPAPRQVTTHPDGSITLSAAILVPDSAAAVAPGAGQRIATTTANPTGIFLTSDAWQVPDGINIIWVDAIGGGGGGGGGNSTPGGGGGGGSSGIYKMRQALAVTPGELITVAIGIAGVGGAANTNGSGAGSTTITGSVSGLLLQAHLGSAGVAGASPNGGTGGDVYYTAAGALGGAGAGANATVINYLNLGILGCAGGAGGALNFSGGYGGGMYSIWYPNLVFGSLATGNASGGGGGQGGASPFGTNAGGIGGSNGAAGSLPPATNYGAGGGGGSGNSAGANGRPGAARIFY